MKIFAEQLIKPTELIRNALITIEDGVITSISTGTLQDADLHSQIVIPGFVDMHCHGGNGFHFFGTEPEAIQESARFHLIHGTTSIVASFVLSEAYCGAHNPDFLTTPNVAEIQTLLDAGEGWIKMITLAPELEGALDSISFLEEQGVIAAIGHSDADDSVTKSAIDSGAKVVTHFFSAMRPIHHRIGGMTLTSLFDDRIYLELILDNVHIATNAIAIPLHFASERILGITDALSVAGQPDGDYTLGTTPVELRNGIAKIKGKDLLAGSTLTMDRSFKSAVTKLGLTPHQAVQAFSSRPASILGLKNVGDIKVGNDADLLFLDDEFSLQSVVFKGVLQ